MKSILAVLLMGFALFAQDVIVTPTKSISGKVVAIDSSYIALIVSGNENVSVAVHKNLKSIVLDSTETILDNEGLTVGPDHRLWSNETRFLAGKNYHPLKKELSDTLKTSFAGELRKLDNDDRQTLALERIALVLTIELALSIVLIVIALTATP
ncbi:MAG: hypothetical protein HQ556_07135 [Candidatus Marinimicrobia bacterium]|nr:hypothetical protein [Candidatus Neomarinimicrobiota bacterium]